MKKFLAVVLSILITTSMFFSVSADEMRDFDFALAHAENMQDLGLFLGTENGFELEKCLTRSEAIALMIRLLGKDEEAASYGKTHPFSDVATWADGYVSYAYDAGLTKGISNTLFGSEDKVTSNMYLTFILRALGYEDGAGKDFIWQMPYALAGECEMLPPETELKNFSRADAVTIACASLFAKCKDTGLYLYEKLIAENVFSKEAWEQAFPQDPFYEYKTLNRAVEKAVPLHTAERNKHTFNQYILLDAVYTEDEIQAQVLVFSAHMTINKDNEIPSRGSGGRMQCVVLDRNSYEVLPADYPVSSYVDLLPESSYSEINNYLWQGMSMLLGKEIDKALLEGRLAYRPLTYEEAMLELNESWDTIDTIESEQCTIAIGGFAAMHGPHGHIRLIYKPGSTCGDGTVISLPIPPVNEWRGTNTPEKIDLSEDGLTLKYSYSFDDELISITGELLHEKGTYNYTVDLLTGETQLEIIKNE